MEFVFVPFGGRAPSGAIACDGLVSGAALDLSHWSHNRTPIHLKRDTSAEIALVFAEERARHDLRCVANNHFDTDGVLAIWAVLSPDLARAHRDLVVSAAVCGDFDEWPQDRRGVWLDAAIGVLAGDRSDSRAYAHVLPMLDALVPSIGAREDLWGRAEADVEAAEAAVAAGRVHVEKRGRIAVVRHAPKTTELPGLVLSKLRPSGTDRVLLAFEEAPGAFRYRYELPRYAWADTVDRPKLKMPRRGPIRRALGDAWVIKGRKGMTGIAYTPEANARSPELVASTLEAIDRG
jgi:hypothetical protein